MPRAEPRNAIHAAAEKVVVETGAEADPDAGLRLQIAGLMHELGQRSREAWRSLSIRIADP